MSQRLDVHQQLLAHAAMCCERDRLLLDVEHLRDSGKTRQARAPFAKAEKLQQQIQAIAAPR